MLQIGIRLRLRIAKAMAFNQVVPALGMVARTRSVSLARKWC